MSYKPTGRPVGRPKVFSEEEIPTSVARVVSAYCADFPRREKIIMANRADEKTIKVYKRLNEAIYAALSLTEEALRSVFLRDIAENRGYGQSAASRILSYRAYYKRKRQIIYNIACFLELL